MKLRAQFPTIIAKIQQQWQKDGLDADDFLTPDIFHTVRQATSRRVGNVVSKVGLDSRGAAINRTLLGGNESYHEVVAKRDR